MHYIVDKTNRLSILQFLVEKMGGRPDLIWKSQCSMSLARRRTFFIKYLMAKYPLPDWREAIACGEGTAAGVRGRS